MLIEIISYKQDFRITNGYFVYTEVIYNDMFSYKISTDLLGVTVDIKPRNIWNSKFDIFKNGIDCGDLIFNWKGEVIMRLIDDTGQETNYLFKSHGFFGQHMLLYDIDEKVIFSLKPSFDWSKFKRYYKVGHICIDYSEQEIVELLLYAAYGANLIKARQNSG